MTGIRIGSAVAALGLALTACSPAPETAETPAPQTEPAAVLEPLPMPLPINAMMVSLVDFAADGVWRPAAQETEITDEQWLYIVQDATNLVVSTTLMTTPGTGANDAEWVQNADWRMWSQEMQDVALQAKAAAESKDRERLKLAGDRLVELCQACHQEFNPGLPTMGINRFPIYPKRPDATP